MRVRRTCHKETIAAISSKRHFLNHIDLHVQNRGCCGRPLQRCDTVRGGHRWRVESHWQGSCFAKWGYICPCLRVKTGTVGCWAKHSCRDLPFVPVQAHLLLCDIQTEHLPWNRLNGLWPTDRPPVSLALSGRRKEIGHNNTHRFFSALFPQEPFPM